MIESVSTIEEEVSPRLDGRAFQSFLHTRPLLEHVVDEIKTRNGSVGVLDYGTGRYGVGRAVLESLTKDSGHLYLYDPHTDIERSTRDNVDIVPFYLDPKSHKLPHVDLVNLSYVLCCMSAEEAEITLESLRMSYPHAIFTVVDYILAHRSKTQVLTLLNTNQERNWLEQMGEDSFLETHMRFDFDSLIHLIRGTSYEILHAEELDDGPFRTGIIATPVNSYDKTH
jgi:hypothetical protein